MEKDIAVSSVNVDSLKQMFRVSKVKCLVSSKNKVHLPRKKGTFRGLKPGIVYTLLGVELLQERN